MPGLGRKLFTRERATVADVQGYLMDQTVMRFSSASARATGITVPSIGMVTILDTAPGALWAWDGSAWQPVTGRWTNLVSSLKSYQYSPGASWGGIADYTNLSVVVPTAKELEVEWRTPRVNLGGSTQLSARLRINGTTRDSFDVVAGTSSSSGAFSPRALIATVIGGGGAVTISVEALRAGSGGAFIEGSGVTNTGITSDGEAGPSLRYRIN